MSPFGSQVNLLRQIASSKNLSELNIGSLDAFQGLEHRAVIICTTRARSRFLAEDERRGVSCLFSCSTCRSLLLGGSERSHTGVASKMCSRFTCLGWCNPRTKEIQRCSHPRNARPHCSWQPLGSQPGSLLVSLPEALLAK